MSQEISINCSFCDESMPQNANQNYRCTNPECGKGYIVGPHGVSVEKDLQGRTIITAAHPLRVVKNG